MFPFEGQTTETCRSFKACWSNLLGVGADPVDDSILVKVMLVSEGEGLPFPQLPHKHKGRALKVVPLLGHLGEQQQMSSDTDWDHTSRFHQKAGSYHLQQVLLQ